MDMEATSPRGAGWVGDHSTLDNARQQIETLWLARRQSAIDSLSKGAH
jgi:hypothetical protein